MSIKHEEITVNGLYKSVYEFWFNESKMQLVLGVYEEFERTSKGKKWYSVGKWNRTNEPHLRHHNSIRREDIPYTSDKRQIALEKFIQQITVESFE